MKTLIQDLKSAKFWVSAWLGLAGILCGAWLGIYIGTFLNLPSPYYGLMVLFALLITIPAYFIFKPIGKNAYVAGLIELVFMPLFCGLVLLLVVPNTLMPVGTSVSRFELLWRFAFFLDKFAIWSFFGSAIVSLLSLKPKKK